MNPGQMVKLFIKINILLFYILCFYFLLFFHWFIDFMLAGKTLIDYTSLFSTYDFETNGNIIFSYFKMSKKLLFKMNKINKIPLK